MFDQVNEKKLSGLNFIFSIKQTYETLEKSSKNLKSNSLGITKRSLVGLRIFSRDKLKIFYFNFFRLSSGCRGIFFSQNLQEVCIKALSLKSLIRVIVCLG